MITADTLNFETQETYSVRIGTDDQNGGTYSESFDVTITDINDAPDDVTISNATIKEGLDIGTLVGIFGTIDQDDPDRVDTYTYNLVPGTGSDNNSAFSIQSNNQLMMHILIPLFPEPVILTTVVSKFSIMNLRLTPF